VTPPAVMPEPLAAARELSAEIAHRAPETEAGREVAADLVERIRAAGLFSLFLPAELGGQETDPGTVLDVIIELSDADPATGWTVLIGNTAAFLAWLAPDAAAEVARRTPAPIVAGSMAPAGRGEIVDGGFRVSGRWPFSSGCRHADWLMGGFIETREGRPQTDPSGAPRMRVAFFPAADAEVIDTWHVAGLRGTGSHDIQTSELFVPQAFTAVPYSEPARLPGPLYRLSPYNLLMVLLAGFPLGVARRAVRELTALAATKRRGGGGLLLEDPLVTAEVLAAEAELYAATAGAREAIADAWRTLRADEEITVRQRVNIAAAGIHAFDVGRRVVDTAFEASGATALYSDHPLQRCLRDIHAAGQHIAFGADARRRLSRTSLGLPTPPAIFQV